MGRYSVTERGFRIIATRAGAEVRHQIDGSGFSWIMHPATGNILQRSPDGSVSVHTDAGSWSTATNNVTTLTRMWKGLSPR